MSLLQLILLSILLSIHSEGASACTVPPYSSHEVNLTAENEALLLTEGRCYLRCVSTRRYRVRRCSGKELIRNWLADNPYKNILNL